MWVPGRTCRRRFSLIIHRPCLRSPIALSVWLKKLYNSEQSLRRSRARTSSRNRARTSHRPYYGRAGLARGFGAIVAGAGRGQVAGTGRGQAVAPTMDGRGEPVRRHSRGDGLSSPCIVDYGRASPVNDSQHSRGDGLSSPCIVDYGHEQKNLQPTITYRRISITG